MPVAAAAAEPDDVVSEERAEIRRLRTVLVDMRSDRDEWRRYANGLEARLAALGYVIEPEGEA